jgi:cyanate lyase
MCWNSKVQLVSRLLTAKEASGRSYDQIAQHCGWTNAYAAQILLNQAQLHPRSVHKFREAVPGISEEDLRSMQRCPMRSFDPQILQDPLVYRLQEAGSIPCMRMLARGWAEL